MNDNGNTLFFPQVTVSRLFCQLRIKKSLNKKPVPTGARLWILWLPTIESFANKHNAWGLHELDLSYHIKEWSFHI